MSRMSRWRQRRIDRMPSSHHLTLSTRWLLLSALSILLTALIFLALGWLIRAPDDEALGTQRVLDAIHIAREQPPPPEPPNPPDLSDNAPQPAPAAPPALGQPDLPPLDTPSIALTAVDLSNISVPLAFGSREGILGGGAFAGFGSGSGAGGNGNGNGSGGVGSGGRDWKGKPLVPLSTARPQMPEWACKQKLSGWVEALFVVMPNGHVRDVRILDADPKGVFEAAAVQSISKWLYSATGKAAQVKQRVPMNHEDCAYNW